MDLWEWFIERFQRTYVSSTKKEEAFVRMRSLKMKNEQLDEYIAEHQTLMAELEWDPDSEMALHSFREGLPDIMARKILDQDGFPETMKGWIKAAQRTHARYAMGKALGYYGKKKSPGTFPHNTQTKRKRDPDAMDVDRAEMDPALREKLMKSGSCFRCQKQGHLARDCPKKKERDASINEAQASEEKPKKTKDKKKSKEDEPPSYDTIIKQINACSMEERQKLLEAFTGNNDEEEGEDF
jgi:hypothetical protein